MKRFIDHLILTILFSLNTMVVIKSLYLICFYIGICKPVVICACKKGWHGSELRPNCQALVPNPWCSPCPTWPRWLGSCPPLTWSLALTSPWSSSSGSWWFVQWSWQSSDKISCEDMTYVWKRWLLTCPFSISWRIFFFIPHVCRQNTYITVSFFVLSISLTNIQGVPKKTQFWVWWAIEGLRSGLETKVGWVLKT